MRQPVFKNQDEFREMLSLRQEGWALRTLATKYHCDHSYIRKLCIKNGVNARVHLLRAVRYIKNNRVYEDWNDEKVMQPKPYASYLKPRKSTIFMIGVPYTFKNEELYTAFRGLC